MGTTSRTTVDLRIVGHRLPDTDGGPRCVPVRPPIVRWQVVPAEEGGAG